MWLKCDSPVVLNLKTPSPTRSNKQSKNEQAETRVPSEIASVFQGASCLLSLNFFFFFLQMLGGRGRYQQMAWLCLQDQYIINVWASFSRSTSKEMHI